MNYWSLHYDVEKALTLAVSRCHDNIPDKPWLDNKVCLETDLVDGESFEFAHLSTPQEITLSLLTRGLGDKVVFQYEGKWLWSSW